MTPDIRMLNAKIAGPQAWTRDTIKPGDWTVELTPAALAELRAVVKERHSYEARVSGTRWREASPAGLLPEFDLVEASGAVVVAGAVSNEDVNLGPYSAGRTLRWIANANQPVYLRALAGTAARRKGRGRTARSVGHIAPAWKRFSFRFGPTYERSPRGVTREPA